MNPNGTGLVQLTDNGVADHGGDWSPDALKIYFTRNPPGAAPTEIGVMNADGSNQTRLTTNVDPEADVVPRRPASSWPLRAAASAMSRTSSG